MWDPADPVLTNLERVLGVEMPGPADSNREEWGVECGICYTYKLEDRLQGEETLLSVSPNRTHL